jgi:hypothetical protein
MSEEMDRAKWTLPPPEAIGIGLLVFAVLAGVVFYLARAKPVVAGSIDNVAVVSPTQDQVMLGINFNFTNVLPEKSVWIRSISARLTKPDGTEIKDIAASTTDFERYFQAFPALKENAIEPFPPDLKLSPGQSARGMIIVSFPVDRQTFDQRKGLAVLLDPYDQLPVVIGGPE